MKNKINGLSYTSFGLGLGALFPIFGMLLFIPAFIVGIVAISKQRNWASWTGFILSTIAFIYETYAFIQLGNAISQLG